jgi:hypothetical protein
MSRPDLSTVPAWYHNYIKQIQENEVNEAIKANTSKVFSFLKSIPEEKWDHRYADNKWSIREMIQHIIDGERIFAFRALCIARGETASLPGFDENSYAARSKADRRSKVALLSEFEAVRTSIELLFASFDDEQLAVSGIANNYQISVNAIGFIIPGHVQHHMNILKERYL